MQRLKKCVIPSTDMSIPKQFTENIERFSKENELKAWELIFKLANRQLNQYPTSLEEDYKILRKECTNQHLEPSIRSCVHYRYSEKMVLNFLKDCSVRLKVLTTMTAIEARQQVKIWIESNQVHYQFKRYFDQVFYVLLP